MVLFCFSMDPQSHGSCSAREGYDSMGSSKVHCWHSSRTFLLSLSVPLWLYNAAHGSSGSINAFVHTTSVDHSDPDIRSGLSAVCQRDAVSNAYLYGLDFFFLLGTDRGSRIYMSIILNIFGHSVNANVQIESAFTWWTWPTYVLPHNINTFKSVSLNILRLTKSIHVLAKKQCQYWRAHCIACH